MVKLITVDLINERKEDDSLKIALYFFSFTYHLFSLFYQSYISIIYTSILLLILIAGTIMTEKAGDKRKRSFGTYFSKKAKVESDIEAKYTLTDFKELFKKPYAEQKKIQLVLMIMDVDDVKQMTVPSKPLNFGLYDVNGITVESATFTKNNKMRIVSKLEQSEDGTSVAVISNWEWYSSSYDSIYQIRNKVLFNNTTELNIVGTEKLTSSDIIPFKLGYSMERLLAAKSCTIVETCALMVAKPPIHFYQHYDGVLVSDGTYFGILAITKDNDGRRVTEFVFDTDVTFKLLKVNAKFMEVESYGLNPNDLKYFLLDGIKTPPVFYVDSKTKIVEADTMDIDFGDREESDIVYPEKSNDDSMIPLNDYFQKIQIK